MNKITDYFKALPQYLLPHHPLSRAVGLLVRCRIPWFKNLLIDGFRRLYNVDLSLAAESDPHAYPDFNAFFTRALRPDARPLPAAEEAGLLQAKGRNYSLTQLLGSVELADRFQGGNYATIYLSPRDYHRIHMPLRGRLRKMVHIPGRLFSVSPATARVIPDLFARNERVVCLFETEAGPMAMVLVGAIFVASIETVWAGVVTPPAGKRITQWEYEQDAPELERGAEMGRFNMGSTVIQATFSCFWTFFDPN